MDSRRFISFGNIAKIFHEYEGYKNMTKKKKDMNIKKDDTKKNPTRNSLVMKKRTVTGKQEKRK